MNKNNFILKFNLSFVIILFIYLVAGVFVAKYYQYEGLRGDTTAYIGIAQKYFSGDFKNAINGFWAPLFSWLLVPFLHFSSTPLSAVFSARVLILITGLITLIGARILTYRFELTETIRNIILFSLIPIILSFASFEDISPDLLFLCILVFYLGIVFKTDYPDRLYNGVLSGILGAMAYFSKPFGFTFFISHFLLINIYHYFRSSSKVIKKNVLRNLIVGLALFSIISGIWIGLISNKYHSFTIAPVGVYNRALVAPGLEWPPHSNHRELDEGFLEPPNKTAINIWEDLTYVKVKFWSPIESWDSFKHQIKLIFKNIYDLIYIFLAFSPLSAAIIVVYILLLVQPLDKLIQRGDILYPFLTMVLFTGGYSLIYVSPRYLWVDNILLLIMGGCLLNVLFRNEFFNKARKTTLTIVFVLSFIAVPLKDIVQKSRVGEEIYNLSKDLESYNIKRNIASNRDDSDSDSNMQLWDNTIVLSYYLNTRYYGPAGKNISGMELENELRKFNIDYYFIWGESNKIPGFLSKYEEITKGGISRNKILPTLKIFSLKKKE